MADAAALRKQVSVFADRRLNDPVGCPIPCSAGRPGRAVGFDFGFSDRSPDSADRIVEYPVRLLYSLAYFPPDR